MNIHEHKKWRFKAPMDALYQGHKCTIIAVRLTTAEIVGPSYVRTPREVPLSALEPDLTSPATQGWIRSMLEQAATIESETRDELTVTWCTKGPDQYQDFRGDDFEEKCVPALLAVWG